MNRIIIILIFTILAGCSSQHFLPAHYNEENIPGEAEAIILVSRLQADSLYQTVQDSLAHHGYMLAQNNENLLALSTRTRNIGHRIQVRMSFLIESLRNNNSRMIVRGEWKKINATLQNEEDSDEDSEENPPNLWKTASWKEPDSSKRAFAHIVQFVHTLPHANISYN